MKSKKEELVQNILLLLKLDAQSLFHRIKDRRNDYLMEFSLKRTREHFKDIFFNRYQQTTLDDLKCCGQEVIVALDQFYSQIDEMKWYLFHTQDMTNKVGDNIDQYIRTLRKKYETLNLYVDVELGNAPPVDNIPSEESSSQDLSYIESMDSANFASDEDDGQKGGPMENF